MSQCSHSPHRQCLEQRLAHSYWMPASHSNGPLPLLPGIQPAELRRMGATLSLAHRGSLEPNHILYGLLSESSDTRQVRLRSRRPFVPAARNILDNLARHGIRASDWTNHKWNAEYYENVYRLRAFVPGPVGICQACWDRLTPSSLG